MTDGVEIKVGRVRNGQLTRDAERTHVELDGLEGRPFVLVALPRDVPLPMALQRARETLEHLPAPHGRTDVDPLRADE